MASLSTRIADLATRIATEIKSVRLLVSGGAADLSALSTTQKGNLVAALNEVVASVVTEATARAGLIADGDSSAQSTATTASNAKIRLLISQAVSGLVASSPGALDTLKELADAIGDDPNFSASMSTALGNRLRLDAAQTLTSAQQTQGRANLDVYSKADIGTPDTDFAAVFTAGLS